MKLYTEEQVIKMIEKSRQTGLTAEFLIFTNEGIELPSVEEIKKSNPYRPGGGNYNGTAALKWQKGVEWVINKIQGCNK